MKYWKSFQKFVALTVFSVSLVSCGDSNYPYIEGNTYEEGGVTVFVPSVNLQSDKQWCSSFNVYALRNSKDENYEETNVDPDFSKLNNKAYCLINNKTANYLEDGSNRYILDPNVKFPEDFKSTKYTFFANYNNLVPTSWGNNSMAGPRVSNNQITRDFSIWEPIFDIVYGVSSPINSIGARKNNPVLKLKHALAKVNFKFSAPSALGSGFVKLSTYKQGTFTVAATDLENMGVKPRGTVGTYRMDYNTDQSSYELNSAKIIAPSDSIGYQISTGIKNVQSKWIKMLVKPGYEYFVEVRFNYDKNKNVVYTARVVKTVQWNTKD